MIRLCIPVGRRLRAAGLVVLAAHATAAGGMGAPLRLVPVKAELVMSGSSTLRRWRCTSTRIAGELVFDGDHADWTKMVNAIVDGHPPPAATWPALDVHAVFRPDSLQCPHPRMKRDLLDAIRAHLHPEVRYEVTGLDGPLAPCESDPGVRKAVVRGRLSFAGETRDIVHEARIRIRDLCAIEIWGEIHVNMRDFNIDPPIALMGLLRAHEEVSIAYRLDARLAHAETGAGSDRSAPESSE